MELLIRDANRPEYMRADGQWDRDASRALHFHTAVEAVKYVESRRLAEAGARVVWKAHSPEFDWVLWPRP